ncbi:MAG: AraC family transcriptional regulator [Muribaculaceae bacterium]|nr:AraC family transcriptional regulator [Muribaculaceae bacterium]
MSKIVLDSLKTYNDLYGLKTSHPLIGVLDLKDATKIVNHIEMKFEVFALFLKQGVQCSLKYGRKNYDYQEGTIVSFAPGQVVELADEKDELAPKVVGLMFHPDLIYGTPLASKIKDFEFFSFSQTESLHLSEKEREKFNFFLNLIREELERPIDNHTASVLAAHIQLLLEHLDRFYDRQFITRHKVNSDIVSQFQQNLQNYFLENEIVNTPNVGYFAEKASLSTGYFSNLIKKETGTSPKDLISLKLIDEAKRRLIETNQDISVIAYSLGFDYPAHFTRLFKKITGLTPTEYRLKVN